MPQIVWPPPGFRIKESEYVLHPMEADSLIQRLTVKVELETVPVVPPDDSEPTPVIVEG